MRKAGAQLNREYGEFVRATAWHNGTAPEEANGYGVRLTPKDRDKYFQQDWSTVLLELDGGGEAEVELSPSFWRSCSELRSPSIGQWLLDQGAAPWPARSAPGLVVTPTGDNRFAVRVLKLRTLGSG